MLASPRGLLVFCLALALFAASRVGAGSVDVLPLRIDNPKPDGEGVAFIKLRVDPRSSSSSASLLASFKIVRLNFVPGQQLKLWNDIDHNCGGDVLSNDDIVPANGKVCFWADTSAEAEFENSFSYAAVDGSSNSVGPPHTVTIVNYNVQSCPSIPDLGNSGFASAPPGPDVSITLSGLMIRFEVTAAYVRNHTAWRTSSIIPTFDSCVHEPDCALTVELIPSWL
jgi:hypothetical protein